MSGKLQVDMRNLSLGRRHLVNAYEVEAGIVVIAGNTVWFMPERLECEVLQKARYINTLTFTFYLYRRRDICSWTEKKHVIIGLCHGSNSLELSAWQSVGSEQFRPNLKTRLFAWHRDRISGFIT